MFRKKLKNDLSDDLSDAVTLSTASSSLTPEQIRQFQQLQQQAYYNQVPQTPYNQGTLSGTIGQQPTCDLSHTFRERLLILLLLQQFGKQKTKRLLAKGLESFSSAEVIENLIDDGMRALEKLQEDEDENLDKVIDECAKEIKM